MWRHTKIEAFLAIGLESQDGSEILKYKKIIHVVHKIMCPQYENLYLMWEKRNAVEQ